MKEGEREPVEIREVGDVLKLLERAARLLRQIVGAHAPPEVRDRYPRIKEYRDELAGILTEEEADELGVRL